MALDAREWGAYYTSITVAQYLARWAIRSSEDQILEPSFGDGAFLEAALARIKELGGAKENIYAVELRAQPFREYAAKGVLQVENSFLGDFFSLDPFPVEVVIGNPPYIRLRNLHIDSRQTAITKTENLGVKMLSSGSVWMPFLIHSASFLQQGGRIAFVLPFEMTYVKYAQPLWKFLGRSFGKVRVLRTHEDLFPDNDEGTILLMADGYGHSTKEIDYELYESLDDLLEDISLTKTKISVESIARGERAFSAAVLSQDQKALLKRLKEAGKIAPISQDCKFKIGYVCGDKRFFHPDDDTIRKYQIPESSLVGAVTNSRQLRGLGLDAVDGSIGSVLYYPGQGLSAGDERYISFGTGQGVSERYKCRMRDPWYLTPGIEIPNLLLTVFAELPLLLMNSGRYAASNSLLCGFIRHGVSEAEIACRWYNSLTLLSIELEVHSLGGGVLILIPGEADRIHVPVRCNREGTKVFMRRLDKLLKEGNVREAYALGDEFVLKESMGLNEDEVELLREAVLELREWRNSSRRHS